MRTTTSRRLAPWGAGLALLVWSGLSWAQDGAPPTGPPVTAPRTNNNKINPARPITDSPPPETTNQLTPVPATIDDPAPPGTNGVLVDQPAVGTVAPAPGTAPARPARRPITGIQQMEGVVTRVSSPGNDLPEERLRITLDPSQDWESYVTRGAMGLAHHNSRNGRTNASRSNTPPPPPAPSSAENNRTDKNHSSGVDLAVTRRTFIYTFARSPEGYDLFGVDNPSAPDRQTSRTGETLRPVAPRTIGPQPASFANIREGSFIAVRFHKEGNLNDVLNLSIIELPTHLATPAAVPGAPGAPPRAPGAAVAPAPAPGGTVAPVLVPAPGTAPARAPAPAGLAPAPRAAAPAAPARVPTVPIAPDAPSFGPR